jgi:hypothetical protein
MTGVIFITGLGLLNLDDRVIVATGLSTWITGVVVTIGLLNMDYRGHFYYGVTQTRLLGSLCLRRYSTCTTGVIVPTGYSVYMTGVIVTTGLLNMDDRGQFHYGITQIR